MNMKRICLLFFIISVAFVLLSSKAEASPDWLTGWQYRKSHVIQNATGAGTNYQVYFNVYRGEGTSSGNSVYLNNHNASTFPNDLNFTDNDEVTPLDYWIEDSNSSWAGVWVEVADDLSSNNVTIYIYYGKSGATSASNGDDTFIFFDDIEVDLSKWTSWGVGSGEKSSTYAYRHTYSFRTEGTVTDYPRYRKTFDSAQQNVSLEVAFRDDSSDTSAGYHPAWLWDGVGTGDRIAIAINTPSTDYQLLQSGWVATGITRSTGWHVLKYYVTTSGYKVEVDDSDETNHWSEKANFGGIRQIDIVTYTGSYAFDGYADRYLLRKYVDPEPTHGSWGSEETSGAVNTVTLNSPSDGTTETTWTVNFNYTPVFHQVIQNASLWFNVSGTWQRVQWNSTAVQNNTENTISYTFSGDGVFIWNVEVFNSTHSVFAGSNWTVTVPPNSVTLNSPTGTETSLTISFNFTPTFYQTIENASLYTNETGSWTLEETNSSAITNDMLNIINHTLPSSAEGTILWNVGVWNSTNEFFATSNATFTLDIIPRYQNVDSNATSILENGTILLYGQGYDGIGLDYAMLSTNETGSWKNHTTHINYTKYSENPLSIPTYGWVYGAVHPEVLYFPDGVDGYKYWMYYELVTTDGVESNALVRSVSDGLTFVDTGVSNPILEASVGEWDSFLVADPSIVKVGTTWYHYYTGTASVPGQASIGLATSSDGKNFTKITDGIDGTSKVLVPTGTDETGSAGLSTSTVHYDGSIFWMIYAAYGTDNIWRFKLASSTDGKNWTRVGVVLTKGTTGQWDDGGIGHPDFVKYGNYYYMHYFGLASGTTQQKIGLASSTDKENWTKSPNNPVLTYEGIWEDSKLYRASWTKNEYGKAYIIDSKIWLYYSADNTTGYNIGLAKGTLMTPPLYLQGVADTWTWSNFTWQNSSVTAGTTIAWRIYYNDTYGNENVTEEMSFTVKIADGSSCSASVECSGGYCVHSICRSASTYCGDGYCDSGEDCSSCSGDCGACSTPSGCPHSVRIKDVEDISAKAGETAIAEITVKNRGCYDEEDIKVYIECADDWECESTTIAELKKHESVTVDLEIKIPEEIASKIYSFDVIAENAFYRDVKELDVIIGKLCKKDSDCETGEICVRRICQSLFDVKIERFDSPIRPGGFLNFTYLVKSMSNVSGDVKISYWLEDNDRMKVSEGSEVIFVGTRDEKLIESNLFVPSDVLGIHTLFVQLDTQGLITTASKTIEIAKEEVPSISDIELPEEKGQVSIYIVLLIVGIIAVFIIIVIKFKLIT